MLVLSRKLGEKIVIGEDIVITVVKIDRNQIRIGIEAPHNVPVYREEIAPQCARKNLWKRSPSERPRLPHDGVRPGIPSGQTRRSDSRVLSAVCSGSRHASSWQRPSGSAVTGP